MTKAGILAATGQTQLAGLKPGTELLISRTSGMCAILRSNGNQFEIHNGAFKWPRTTEEVKELPHSNIDG